MEKYVERSLTYEKLDPPKSEIRLLEIWLSDDGCVQCKLTKCSLNDNPTYYALSYVWGDPTVTQDIVVNGTTFAATVNLVAALEFVSKSDGSRSLWVDAICINQSDIEERNTQVHMMSLIFKNASGVIAWLGPEQDNSTEVIEIMKHMATEIEFPPDVDVEILSRPAPQPLLDTLDLETSGQTLLSLALSREEDFERLLERPFWKRAWIFQELVLAKMVVFICGQAMFRFLDAASVSRWLWSIPDQIKPDAVSWGPWTKFKNRLSSSFANPMSSFVLATKLHDNVYGTEGPYGGPWKFFSFSWSLNATDPRDKVYSLLGLANIGIEVDYSKSPEMVYHDFAATMFGNAPLHEWFRFCGISFRERMPTLPTWSVDWTTVQKEFHSSAAVCSSVRGEKYNAKSGLPDLSRHTKIYGQTLSIFGVLCDEIEFLAPFTGTIESSRDVFKFDITGGLPNEEVLYTLVPPGIPRGQASLRLIFEDKDLNFNRRFVMNSSLLALAMEFASLLTALNLQGLEFIGLSNLESFLKIFLGENVTSSTLEIAGSDRMDNSFIFKRPLLISFERHIRSSRHFYTKEGYLGYGPECLQKGDLVCVLPNCDLPLIFRKVGDYYHHVSTCLVLGLMDGEAAQLLKEGKASMQQFNIR
jgi:Heterokaryon incompatibility protein (HET)